MVTGVDPLHALLNLQRALERSYDSDWLRGSTTGDGVLTITLPKAEEAKPRRINIGG